MIGFLLITHGDTGTALVRSSELILGQQEGWKSLGINLDDSVEDLRSGIRQAAGELERGEGLMVFTDVFGGSTSTSVALELREIHYECLTGVNLPMLLEGFMSRDTLSLEELVQVCCEAGTGGIIRLREKLGE